ncbi:hypothetical protein EOPP23_13340 [Endozoicomonas sp. OPT23]|nr:hypothetical protein [Endozoicomonas sp. OPT23]
MIGVGGIKSVQYIEESLQQGRFNLVAVGRAILENPGLFAKKNGGLKTGGKRLASFNKIKIHFLILICLPFLKLLASSFLNKS